MRTIFGNKEISQTFFHNSSYSQKYDLIRLIPYHCQPCIPQVRDITKSMSFQISRRLRNAITIWYQ